MSLRVLVCGTWEVGPGYPRPRSLLAALRQRGHRVAECRVEPPFGGPAKQRLAARPWTWPGMALRLRSTRARLLQGVRQACAARAPDVVLVPYPGHLVVPWLRREFAGPIVLDLFLSAYDTIVLDRRLLRRGSLAAQALRWLDRRACLAADLTLLDTEEHAAWVGEHLDIPGARIGWVPVSDPDADPEPRPWREPRPGEPLDLLFFGTGVPLHGLRLLVDAVRATPGVRLTLVGGSAADRAVAATLPEGRIRLLAERLPWTQVAAELERCHLAAGVFSSHDKALRVIPLKVVHALAAGRPVLTADTPAVRRLLRPGRDCLVCRPGDAADVAAVLASLCADPSSLAGPAAAARPAYERSFSLAALGERLDRMLKQACGKAPCGEPAPAALVQA